MRTTCTKCGQQFDAASAQLVLERPPICPGCQKTVTITERVSFEDRPEEVPLKEGELRG
jgi:hypothetical protein